MRKLKVALLEDSKALLKELKQSLEDTGLVEAIAYATNSEEFIEKVQDAKPEALVLDIDLAGDTRTGIEVAYKLALPVLFVSGKTTEFNNKIESLDVQFDFIVDRIGKPYSQENLRKKLNKFIAAIRATDQEKHIILDLLNCGRTKIELNSIVFITSVGEDSNNKTIYFKDRKPETLIDFTLKKRDEYGLDKSQFIETHKQYCVNRNHIARQISVAEIEVDFMSTNGQLAKKQIPVSENYRSAVQKILR